MVPGKIEFGSQKYHMAHDEGVRFHEEFVCQKFTKSLLKVQMDTKNSPSDCLLG